MKRAARLAVLAVVLGAVVAPAMAAAVVCPDEGGDACCAPGCVLCLCCSHLRQLVVERCGVESGIDARSLGGLPAAVLASPHARDILHVPRPPAAH